MIHIADVVVMVTSIHTISQTL